jgi:hypothetical protein
MAQAAGTAGTRAGPAGGDGEDEIDMSEQTPRAPRRIVLLKGDDSSEAESVLAEYAGEQVSGTRLHDDLRKLAAEHPGRRLAAEWQGPLGWKRFLWLGR